MDTLRTIIGGKGVQAYHLVEIKNPAPLVSQEFSPLTAAKIIMEKY